MKNLVKTLPSLLFFLFSAASFALPVLPFSAPGGLERLQRSKHKADFFQLTTHFRAQTDRISCGPTTGAIVLNALRYNTEKAPLLEIPKVFLDPLLAEKFDPRLHAYTPESFFNEAALKIKTLARFYGEKINGENDAGLQLEQLKRILEEAHHVTVQKFSVGTKETAKNSKEPKPLAKSASAKALAAMKENLAQKDNYVVVNYARKELAQKGGGHISPVAAYDAQSDSFLVLDVNPFGGPWAWVDAKELVNAMNTFDTEENRGVLLISDKP